MCKAAGIAAVASATGPVEASRPAVVVVVVTGVVFLGLFFAGLLVIGIGVMGLIFIRAIIMVF